MLTIKNRRFTSRGELVFMGAYIPSELKNALQRWAIAEGKDLCELVEAILAEDLRKNAGRCPTCKAPLTTPDALQQN
jgi:hypothetical protein